MLQHKRGKIEDKHKITSDEVGLPIAASLVVALSLSATTAQELLIWCGSQD